MLKAPVHGTSSQCHSYNHPSLSNRRGVKGSLDTIGMPLVQLCQGDAQVCPRRWLGKGLGDVGNAHSSVTPGSKSVARTGLTAAGCEI